MNRPLRYKHFAACLVLTFAAHAAADVVVNDAWIRGTVPGQQATGAFMQLQSGSDASLVAVATPAAKIAQIHEMAMEGGVMKMRAVDSLPLPAGKPVALSPGGYHVMLLDLARPLKEGDSVPLSLTFADKTGRRTTQEVVAKVRALTAPAPKH
jgi:copper(I)-binding protein